MEAMRSSGHAGDYLVPCATSPKSLKDPSFIQKMTKVVAMMTIMPAAPEDGRPTLQWFIYCLVVGVFAAYIADAPCRRTHYWRSSGSPAPRRSSATRCTVAGLDLVQEEVEHDNQDTVDGLIYGLLTGRLRWLWPK